MAQQIDKRDIERTEADRILQIEESHYIDLKAVETEPSSLSEAVSAFSNTAGGELFIGIDEKSTGKKTRRWRGFKDIEATLILNINLYVRVVATRAPLVAMSVDIRGNTDESWSRGLEYLVRTRFLPENRDPP